METIPNLPYGTPLEGQPASEWAVAILGSLHAPITVDNVYSFAGWFLREGGGGQNNPMNTTLGSQYHAINSDGVRDYPTPAIGVAMTVQTLTNWYPAIVDSFRAGVGLERPNGATAAELHMWSGGGYTFISPAPVPMPPEHKTYHYDWFASGHQRKIVEFYDRWRVDPASKRALARLRPQLVAAKYAAWLLYKAHKKNTRHYGWRYQELCKRVENRIVRPVLDPWPQS